MQSTLLLIVFQQLDPFTGSRQSVIPHCIPPAINEFPEDIFTQEQRRSGFVVIHIFATAYFCLVLAIICDQYFVPTLEIIAEGN